MLPSLKLTFIGTGEAFDEELPNTSILCDTGETRLLLDCGYSIPHQVWKQSTDPNFLHGIFLSHHHADHVFGIPALLTRMWETKRSGPLTIIGHKGTQTYIQHLMEMGYPTLLSRMPFPIEFMDVQAGEPASFRELGLSFAQSIHSVTNYSIRISYGGKTVCYSGDGSFSEATQALFRDCDFLIHESFHWERLVPLHASIKELLEMAQTQNVKTYCLIHLQRDFKKKVWDFLKDFQQGSLKLLVPKPGENAYL
jgi:ribonuclease BN (tRNA processing enzyme)